MSFACLAATYEANTRKNKKRKMVELESEILSGNLPFSIMVHNDVLFVSRNTFLRPHAGTVTQGTSYYIYYCICYSSLYLNQSIRIIVKPSDNLSTTSKLHHTPNCIACLCARKPTPCLNVMLSLLDQFHSWNYQMGQMLR
jgi:hypothetical protein